MKVTKRDGTLEVLDISKIQKQTEAATKGLQYVSQSELEVDAQLQFNDGITTEEIQQTLIATAVDKIDIDAPDWTFVAARLFLYDLYHKVPNFAGFEEYLDYGIKAGKIKEDLKDGYDIKKLAVAIKPERDMQFTYLGIKTLHDRYLLKDKDGNVIEKPQYMFMAIAMHLASVEENKTYWAIKFYEVISKFEAVPATPTLSNARTIRHQLSSCFIGATDDSIEGIFDSYKTMALLSKYGGGIGWDWSDIRAIGGNIDGHKGVAAGIIPFLKMTNDVAIAVDQLGTRKGAIAVYIEPWHLDVMDFLDLKKNSGEERRRAHDLFPALWVPDLFMERVLEDSNWTLFDPAETKELHATHGEAFKELYEKFEADENIRKETIKAKDLWKTILRSYLETGSPFLCFKDTFNRRHTLDNIGVIRSSNLCTEVGQLTTPNDYGMSYPGIGEKAQTQQGSTAICNLCSINMSKVDEERLPDVVTIAQRMLDNVIDLNFYPTESVRSTASATRAIGLGVMGEAQAIAERGIEWGSEEHKELVNNYMETFAYYLTCASTNIAAEKGKAPLFESSKWSHGELPYNTDAATGRYDWDGLSRDIKYFGIRNLYLSAIAPTSSISILSGTTQGIEPVFKRKWFEENMSGMIPVTAPNLSAGNWEFYKSAYEVDQLDLVRLASVRQNWIDQAQSLNVFVNPENITGKDLHDIYMTAWKSGVKSTYYLRSMSPEAEVEDRSLECTSCQ